MLLRSLSFIYGIHLVGLIYLFTYLSVRGIFKQGSFSIFIALARYFIYWQVITFGFHYLDSQWILLGTIAGIYISLILSYFVNKKISGNEQYEGRN